MRGRKPLPDNVRQIRGNPGKRRPNPRAPQGVPGTPEKPAWIARSSRASAAWDILIPQLKEMGVLTQADQLALEALCGAYADWRRKRTAAMLARFQSLLGEFGLTPSARSRIRLPDKPKGDYGEFRRGKKPGDDKS